MTEGAGGTSQFPKDSKGDPQAFKAAFEPALQSLLVQNGLKPTMAPAILAQLALETGHGKSINGNNIGNIKAGPGWSGEVQWLPTTEYVNGQPVQKLEPFRKYSSIESGLADYMRLVVSNPHYKGVLSSKSPAEFFQELQKSGYATDPAYASKVASVFSTLYPD